MRSILIVCLYKFIIDEVISIRLGALFDTNVDQNKRIFQYAIEKANENLLSKEEFILEGEVATIVRGNDFSTSRELCALLEVKLTFFTCKLHAVFEFFIWTYSFHV